MIDLGKDAEREVKDYLLSRYGGTMPEDLPTVESIKKIEKVARKELAEKDEDEK